MERDWSQIGADCLQVVAEKLTQIVDYHSLRLVCRDWKPESVPQCPLHRVNIPPQLMLVEHQLGEGDATSEHQQTQPRTMCRFINFLDGEVYSWCKNLPQVCPPNRVCGSSHGWLVLINTSGEIFCFNPVTLEKVTLPPLSKFPYVEEIKTNNDNDCDYEIKYRVYGLRGNSLLTPKQLRDCYIKKIIVSCSPSNGADYTIVAIIKGKSQLAYCKKGDSKWNFVPYTLGRIEDVIYSKGLFYVLHKKRLVICDLSGSLPNVKMIDDVWIEHRKSINAFHYIITSEENYEINGLFLVSRILQDDMPLTKSFHVYKLDNNNVWVKQSNIGGNMFFIGLNSSFSLQASNARKGVENSLYFSDDRHVNEHDVDNVYSDMGNFDLVDELIKSLPYFHEKINHEPSSCYSIPVWFTPNPW